MGNQTNSLNTSQTIPHTLFSDEDIELFKSGKHYSLYEKLGSHVVLKNDMRGVYFSVWAPNAEKVSVIGDFNEWNPNANTLFTRWDSSGIWEGFIPNVESGSLYKYYIQSKVHSHPLEKADPFALRWQSPPDTASVVWEIDYQWSEDSWLQNRHSMNKLDNPISVYEVHLGSWKRSVEENGRSLTYIELAEDLPQYLLDMGFTHVEFLPIMEHPFTGSWGYQTLGYFAPTSRFGTPQEFMRLIESLHSHNIGVILDWVPSHFPTDMHGIGFFDGTHLFEHADPRRGFHPDWKSCIFNYGRNEVRSFLISSALFWFDKYHIDGLRVDAVASMLYLDYSRNDNEWIPNEYGGNDNIEAIVFLKELNTILYDKFPYAQSVAEESTAWPMVSRPVYTGGLGFGMKWNMGWMHDTLEYFSKDPVHRKFHHHEILNSIQYAFSENFMLPLSHDEVVHGKASLLSKMPGSDWNKFADLRLLFAYMFAHPGKKLLFMGSELGNWDEWNHDSSLPWHLLEYERHKGIQLLIKDLNILYKREPALHQRDFSHEGFEWLETNAREQSIISFIRKNVDDTEFITCICNFTPVVRHDYKIGVPVSGEWEELLNTDASKYGGSNCLNDGVLVTVDECSHGHQQQLNLTIPPQAALILKHL